MVFFNYSSMQMAAKIVYYGPGLGGKTTNLQHIYGHTSRDSRGEMVSLETDTDRTLFFDLLPLDVGNIQGFKTRIQLYTVPGQVFYNTTRKLVLKSVDGVVFVADSQRAMIQANVESLRNLGENLGEIGLAFDSVPIILQYNKRDLKDVCSVEELDAALNEHRWPSFEASAINGGGVFETLKAVSKMTLLGLRKRLSDSAPGPKTQAPEALGPAVSPAESPTPAQKAQATEPVTPRTEAIELTAVPAVTAQSAEQSAPVPGPEPPTTKDSAEAAVRSAKVDILAELEKIRLQTAQGKGSVRNGRRRIEQDLSFPLSKDSLRRTRRLTFSLEIEDQDRRVVDSWREGIDVEDAASIDQLLVRLNIALQPRD